MPRSRIFSPQAEREVVDELMRRDLTAFVRRSFETVVPGETLRLNWHIHAMTYTLEQVRQGKIKRLIITIPPRHLKSITTSVAFPAFLLGHDPSAKVVCVSYSTDLAIKHARDCKAVMTSHWYRRLFPGMCISEKNTELETVTTQRGYRLATSPGATLTGLGGNYIILDDPMNPKQAMSKAQRSSVIQWFGNTLLTRLNDKSHDVIIVVMQRLHVDDLVGVLLEQGGWHHLDLPAIADAPQKVAIGRGKFYRRKVGDILHPALEPAPILAEIKARMGTMDFSAQYLQRPIPAEGNLIKREWIKLYRALPEKKPGDYTVISWDTALKPTEISDYSVGTVWQVQGDNCYLIDLVRGRFDFTELKRAVMRLKAQWSDAHILIEDKGSGTSLIQELRREQVNTIPITPDVDKVTRLYATQPRFESGSVLFPEGVPWLDGLIGELLGFPEGRHDDQVDSISQALSWIEKRKQNQVPWVWPVIVRVRNPYREAFPDYRDLP
jgi:predicted phage terminase large subunit-like protein